MKLESSQVAGVVVLYNPDENVLENIYSFLTDIAKLFIIDNSETPVLNNAIKVLLTNPKVEYIANKANLGIAAALNKGAELALNSGYKWLLTMDQDSKATSGMIKTLLNAINTYPNPACIGIMSPVQSTKFIPEDEYANPIEEVEAVMTSGNLLNLQVYTHVGRFHDDFFIDYVDLEYCLRLRKNNYKVLVASEAILRHNLGNVSEHTIWGFSKKNIITTNHNFIRRYYITRNRLMVQKLYKKDFPEFCKYDFKCMCKEFIKVCLIENHKWKKINSYLRAVYHFKIGRLGKL